MQLIHFKNLIIMGGVSVALMVALALTEFVQVTRNGRRFDQRLSEMSEEIRKLRKSLKKRRRPRRNSARSLARTASHDNGTSATTV